MISALTLNDCEPLVGKTLDIFFDQVRTPVTLLAATPLGADADPRRQRAPFSLLFLAPPGPVAPQAIYRVQAETLGTIEIFLVPLGADANGVKYEAIFG